MSGEVLWDLPEPLGRGCRVVSDRKSNKKITLIPWSFLVAFGQALVGVHLRQTHSPATQSCFKEFEPESNIMAIEINLLI